MTHILKQLLYIVYWQDKLYNHTVFINILSVYKLLLNVILQCLILQG